MKYHTSILGLLGLSIGNLLYAQDVNTLGEPETRPDTASNALQVVASFNDQVTGVAVSKKNRIFVNFPNWAVHHTTSVAEVHPDGTTTPYPDLIWNDVTHAISKPESHFVCVQSVYVDDADKLWVLDAAAPLFGSVVDGGAKLVKIDLATDTVEHVYQFDPVAAPANSYLNDVRIDTARQFAYVSDSGLGAILVLNLQTGDVRRVLNQVPETLGNPGLVMRFGGEPLNLPSGQSFTINCDGIALNHTGDRLYFAAPTNGKLYSIATADLRDKNLDDTALEKKIQFEANIGPSDGFATAPNGILYVTSVLDHSIKQLILPISNSAPAFALVADDPRLVWPDSMAWSSDHYLYVTASQIPLMPRFHNGQDMAQGPYQLFRFQPEPKAVVAVQ